MSLIKRMEEQMIKSLNALSLAILILLVSFIFGCGKIKDRPIAKIGDRIISLGAFENDFKKDKAKNVIDAATDSMKLEHLNRMIDKELKILEAYEQKLDQDSLLVLRMKEREKNEVGRKVWINEVVKKVIPDSEVREFYENSQKEIKIRDIVLRVNDKDSLESENEVKNKIQKLYEDLKNGARFDSLARRFSQNRITAANGGDLGFVKWHPGNIKNELYRIAFQLDEGEISKPFKMKNGYHIIKIEEIKHKESAEAYAKQKERIRERLIRLKSREIRTRMYNYLDELKKKYNGKINAETIQLIVDKLNAAVDSDTLNAAASDSTNKIEKPSRPKFPNDFSKLSREDQNLILFEYDGGKILVSQIINMAKRYPPHRQPDFTKEKNLKEFLDGMILFEVFVYEGYQRGYDDDEEFRKLWTDQIENSIQQRIYQKEVVDKSKPTEDELKKYYEAHQEKYKDRPFDRVKNQLRNELTQKNRSKRDKDWLNDLRKKHKVVIYGNRLHAACKDND